LSEGDEDPVARLGELLRQAGAHVVIDPGNNHKHPCTFCGTPPQTVHELRAIGCYPNGDTIRRPVCKECSRLADDLEKQRSELDAENMVPLKDVTADDFYARAVLHTLSHKSLERYNIDREKGVVVELRFNGISTPLKPFIAHLQSEFERIVNLAVGAKIQDLFNDRVSAIHEVLYNAERNLKTELYAKGLLREDDIDGS